MIDNELRQQYRQAVDDLKIVFKKTYLYRFCEEFVKRLSKILRQKQTEVSLELGGGNGEFKFRRFQ